MPETGMQIVQMSLKSLFSRSIQTIQAEFAGTLGIERDRVRDFHSTISTKRFKFFLRGMWFDDI